MSDIDAGAPAAQAKTQRRRAAGTSGGDGRKNAGASRSRSTAGKRAQAATTSGTNEATGFLTLFLLLLGASVIFVALQTHIVVAFWGPGHDPRAIEIGLGERASIIPDAVSDLEPASFRRDGAGADFTPDITSESEVNEAFDPRSNMEADLGVGSDPTTAAEPPGVIYAATDNMFPYAIVALGFSALVVFILSYSIYSRGMLCHEKSYIADSPYFLGFCITLVSLSFAFYELGSEGIRLNVAGSLNPDVEPQAFGIAGASAAGQYTEDGLSNFIIMQKAGIALISSIVGIVGRMFLLHSLKNDSLADEKMLRKGLNKKQVLRNQAVIFMIDVIPLQFLFYIISRTVEEFSLRSKVSLSRISQLFMDLRVFAQTGSTRGSK